MLYYSHTKTFTGGDRRMFYATNAPAVDLTSLGIIALIYQILLIIAQWRIFTKAGEAGWKSVIPILSQYTAFKIAWKPSMFWVSVLFSVLAAILVGLSSIFAELTMILMWLDVLVIAIVAVFGIIFTHKLSRAFRHGVPFTLGLLFLQPIFILILGFGSSEYHGADL